MEKRAETRKSEFERTKMFCKFEPGFSTGKPRRKRTVEPNTEFLKMLKLPTLSPVSHDCFEQLKNKIVNNLNQNRPAT